jgi:hypothetical protein
MCQSCKSRPRRRPCHYRSGKYRYQYFPHQTHTVILSRDGGLPPGFAIKSAAALAVRQFTAETFGRVYLASRRASLLPSEGGLVPRLFGQAVEMLGQLGELARGQSQVGRGKGVGQQPEADLHGADQR